MRKRLKFGAVAGVVFAGLAYLVTYRMGFNPTSLSFLLYLYVFLGLISGFSFEDLKDSWDVLDRFVVVAEEEELKLKKIFTGEEYRVDGTVEKV